MNAGTVLCVPVAADKQGATLLLAGNNHGNLTVTLNGEPIQIGSETALQDLESPAYLKLWRFPGREAAISPESQWTISLICPRRN